MPMILSITIISTVTSCAERCYCSAQEQISPTTTALPTEACQLQRRLSPVTATLRRHRKQQVAHGVNTKPGGGVSNLCLSEHD